MSARSLSVPSPAARLGAAFRRAASRLGWRAALGLAVLAAGARGAAAQLLGFRPLPPAQPIRSVPVTIAFGGPLGVSAGCGRSAYPNPGDCSDPYYDPNDNCGYGDYGSYACTRTYTDTATATRAPGQSNGLTVAASAYGNSQRANQRANVNATGGPVVTLISPTLLHDPALCALDCGELVQTYMTPSYVSRDVARSLTLVYRSGRARPRPVVELDVQQAPGTPTPDRIGLKLLDANNAVVPLYPGQTETVRRFAPGVVNRLAAQVTIGGVVSLTAVITAYDAGGNVLGTTSVPVVVLVDGQNGAASPYGVGWGIAGLQRWGSQAEGAVIFDGDGSIGLWRTGATSGSVTQYVSPPGDFTQVAWDASAGILTRRYPDGTVVRFDGTGAMISSTDRLGNVTTFSYADPDGSKVRLRAVTDPRRTVDHAELPGPRRLARWVGAEGAGVHDHSQRAVYVIRDRPEHGGPDYGHGARRGARLRGGLQRRAPDDALDAARPDGRRMGLRLHLQRRAADRDGA